MNKKTLLTSAVVLLASTGLVVAAGNQSASNTDKQSVPMMQDKHGHGHHGMMHGRHERNGLPRDLAQLNLSAEQQAKIEAIMKQGQSAVQKPEQDRAAFQQKMEQRRAKEQQLLSSSTFNEQAARALIAERQQERAQMEREHAERELQMLKQRHAVFQVLTPAQQQQYLTNQKQRHAHGFGAQSGRERPTTPNAR